MLMYILYIVPNLANLTIASQLTGKFGESASPEELCQVLSRSVFPLLVFPRVEALVAALLGRILSHLDDLNLLLINVQVAGQLLPLGHDQGMSHHC